MKAPKGLICGPVELFPPVVGFYENHHPGTGDDFRPVDKALREELLLGFFLGAEVHIPGQTIMVFLVKQVEIEIPDPNLMAQGNWTVLCVVTSHYIVALCSNVLIHRANLSST